jgi:drug/metabolite transporter (DMT)-like permease
MLFLILSIFLNAYLGIAFVIFKRFHIDLFQAIVFNYLTCVITGSLVLGEFPIHATTLAEPWFKWAILMGALFISVFNLIAFSSIKAGVTITQTANKLSLVIPFIFSWMYFQESVGMLKIAGIVLAMLAVVFVSFRKHNNDASAWQMKDLGLPFILFLSSGIIDTLTAFVQQSYLQTDAQSNAYLISGFLVAATLGSVVLLIQYLQGKRQFHVKHLLAGIILGIPNYFSIYCLVKALQWPGMSSSAVIPINNIGVLFVVSLVGIFIFKEKLIPMNYWGLFVSLLAILLIILGD